MLLLKFLLFIWLSTFFTEANPNAFSQNGNVNRMQFQPPTGPQNQQPNRNMMAPNQATPAFQPPNTMGPPPPPLPPPRPPLPQPFPMFPPNAMAPSPVPVQIFRQTLLPFPTFQRPLPIAPAPVPVVPALARPLSHKQTTSNFQYSYPNMNQLNLPNQAFNNEQQMRFANPTQNVRPLAMSKKRKAVDNNDFRNVLLQRNKLNMNNRQMQESDSFSQNNNKQRDKQEEYIRWDLLIDKNLLNKIVNERLNKQANV